MGMEVYWVYWDVGTQLQASAVPWGHIWSPTPTVQP